MAFEEHQRRVEERKKRLRSKLERALEGRTRIVFEPGCGHGHWLTDYAMAHPERFCLGIDIIADRVKRANRKRDRAALENLCFIQAEAYETLETLPNDTLVEDLFLLFLDPWPKKRHWKNRLFCDRFLRAAAERSAPKARLHFRTDHRGYFDWAVEVAQAQSLWKIDERTAWPFERETVFQSKAESFQSLMLVRRNKDAG